MTGPTRKTRLAVIRRDEGMCVCCGITVADPDTGQPFREYSLQHRRGRGAGGSRDAVTNSPANLVVLCGDGVSGCHGLVESKRDWGMTLGFAVSRFQDPTTAPMRHHRGWVLVGDTYTQASAAEMWLLAAHWVAARGDGPVFGHASASSAAVALFDLV